MAMNNRKDHMVIVHFGQKHTFSREGGIEVVVNELATRMAARGHEVICYDRTSKRVSGAALNIPRDTKGVKIVPVWTIDRKGLAALTSSFVAAIKASFSKADVVHIHAEGPAAVAWIPKLFGKKVVCTVHGACEIMGSTGEKPVKSRLHGDSVFYPNSNTEYYIKNICSGILKRFCYIPMLLRQSGRAFFCWAFSKPLLFDPGIA